MLINSIAGRAEQNLFAVKRRIVSFNPFLLGDRCIVTSDARPPLCGWCDGDREYIWLCSGYGCVATGAGKAEVFVWGWSAWTTAGCESMGWESPSAKEVISRPTCLQGRGVQPNTFSPRMLPGHVAQSGPREVCALSLRLEMLCLFILHLDPKG